MYSLETISVSFLNFFINFTAAVIRALTNMNTTKMVILIKLLLPAMLTAARISRARHSNMSRLEYGKDSVFVTW